METTLIYAESGTGKTSQLMFLADYFHKKTGGKKGRLVTADGGGYKPLIDEGMVINDGTNNEINKKGIVDVFKISNRSSAYADCRRLAEGFWPRKDKTGREKGLFDSTNQCLTTKEEWNDIGFLFVEGVFSISRLLLNHLSNQESGNAGFKFSVEFSEDGYSFGGLQEGHYGIVQKEMYRIIVQGFHELPPEFGVWTSLVDKGEDRNTGTTIYGPKGAGKATTFEIPSWFGECFHLDSVKFKQKNSDNYIEKRVAWFKNHKHKDTEISFLAKSRVSPRFLNQLYGKFKNGFVELDYEEGVDKYFKFVDELRNERDNNNNGKKT